MFDTVLLVTSYLFTQMCVVWFFYRVFKNPSIVDVSWSLGLMISGLLYLYSQPINSRTLVIGVLLIIWAFRLAGYLWFTRVRKGHVDKRYVQLSESWKISKGLGFFLNFQLQALMILFISSIFLFISQSASTEISLSDGGCILIIALAIIGETQADIQLSRFKKQNPGAVCNVGWWNYSRHPNYFFDWLTWFGFTLLALNSSYGFLSVLPLIFLYIIFTRITGPMTEQGSIQSRGQKYLTYQRQTSMFFPWFKQKNDSE